jgi:uncharacterized protein (TIGR02145 family)
MKTILKITLFVFISICCVAILKSCQKIAEPVVTTNSVTNPTPTSATSGGNVTNNGGAEVTSRGVCWGKTENPIIDSNPYKTNDGKGNGSYSSTMTGLSPNTEYHVRAYAINSEGTGYGKDVKFATSCDSPAAPVVGIITQPTCSVTTGSVVLNSLPTEGTWTLTRTPDGIIATGTGISTTVSGLNAGTTYTFTVTNASGCVSVTSGNVVIIAQPETPGAPVVGTITQPTCSLTTGSVVLSGLPSAGTWTLTRTPGGTTTNGTGASTTVSGIPAGASYTFTVTNASGCVSPASDNVVINVQLATPSAPVASTITQPTCSVASGSVILSGLPSSGNWTLTRSPGSITTSGSGTSTTISNLAAGTYTFTVTNASGCLSAASENVTINSQPGTPSALVVGTITQPTCSVATGSVVLSSLPATGTWTLTRTPGGTTTNGTGASTTVSGIPAGASYTFTVTNALGCVSASSGNVVINAQLATPSAPVVGTITQPTCSVATGSAILSGLPSSGNWTLTRSPGSITTSGSGTSTAISNLAAGTYTFTVTNALGCVSASSGNVVINAQLATPSAPVVGTITQPTCSVATGSVILSGLPSSGNWTLTRNPGGITSSGSGTTLTVSGLPAGITYNFTVTNFSGCVSTASGSAAILPQPTAPAATTGAYSVSANDVVISGTVNPHYSTTLVTFEYGTTTGYGSTIAAALNPLTGNNSTAVSAMLTGLIPDTRYYYRVTASNCAGTTNANGNYFTTLPLTDKDGNTYDVVMIGTQVWMAENLKTTKYSDGTIIPLVTDNTSWSNLTTPGYCWYNNDPTSYKNTYGALYNFYAVSTGKLCPTGWHVPTDAEVTTLTTYLGGASVAGGKLKEIGTTHWSSPNTDATNESGFTAISSGGRNYLGTYVSNGIEFYLWTSTEYDYTTSWNRDISYTYADIFRHNNNKHNGFSVRCIMN